MTLQLSFDGGVRLLDGDERSLRECLALTGQRYASFAAAIDVGESDRAVYWRIIFAVLSVHSPIAATFEAYRTLRLWRARFGRMPSTRKLQSLLLTAKGSNGNVTQYCYRKAVYVREFDKGWQDDKAAYIRNGDSDADWRVRLQRNVKGLGLAKASFAVALSAPATADVCCIDTHMHAVFTSRVPGKAISRRGYLALEERVRILAKEHGLSTFAAQWAIWDAHRGVMNPHLALATA